MFISIKSDFEIPRPPNPSLSLVIYIFNLSRLKLSPQLRGARLSFGQLVETSFQIYLEIIFFRHPNENLLKFDICLKLEEKQNVKVQSNFRREEG